MNCVEAEPHIAAYAVNSLDESAYVELRGHLEGCAGCRVIAGAYVTTAGQLPLALNPVPPPPELRLRILAVVYSDAAGSKATGSTRSGLLTRLWRRVPAARGWTLAGAGAMAVAVVGISVSGLTAGHSSAPAQASVSLAGATAQPLAHGRLTYGKDSHAAVLTINGLAPLASGSGSSPAYEVWLIQPGGKAEAAAYLTAEPKGTTWSAAFTKELPRYSAVAVTLEKSTGNLTPSGDEVMRGELRGIS